MKKKIVELLQKIGKSFMLPISVLPAAGILLGIGSSFTNMTNLENLGLVKVLGPGTFGNAAFTIMAGVGSAIFDNLALIFAVGIAIGMANKQKEASALAAALSYLVMNITINKILILNGTIDDAGNILTNVAEGSITNCLGITTLQIGVFGGIIIGIIVSILHNRFYNIELPNFIAFFGGERFVPIVSIFASIIVGFLFSIFWPFIQNAIIALGNVVSTSGLFGVFFFDFIKRLLIPFGLHHIFYMPFWQTAIGGTIQIGGTTYIGAQNILFAQLADPNTLHISRDASMFFTGAFPIMIFGLPAACLAMYKNAKEEHKKETKSLMLSAAVTSAITGITEPIEFSILFASPILFVVYAVLVGLSNVVCYLLNVTVGCTFSQGMIDLFLLGVLPGNQKTSWLWIIPIGLAFFAVFYFVFDLIIRKYDLKTPGRQDDILNIKINAVKDDASELVANGLGGKENILNISCCSTRLYVDVKNINLISEDELKNTGALGVITVENSLQVIYGAGANLVKNKLDEYFNSKVNSILVRSPMVGTYVKMEDVPDQTFASKSLGEGVAIIPDSDIIYAPADGYIDFIHLTKHAFGFVCKNGVSMLVHVGIGTSKLNGQGFEILVKEGIDVKMGTALVKLDLPFLNSMAESMVSPIVLRNVKDNETVEIIADDHVDYNESILRVVKKD